MRDMKSEDIDRCLISIFHNGLGMCFLKLPVARKLKLLESVTDKDDTVTDWTLPVKRAEKRRTACSGLSAECMATRSLLDKIDLPISPL